MKRYNLLISFLKRHIKELDAYTKENKKIVKYIADELEIVTSLNQFIFSCFSKLIYSMDINETIYDILIRYNVENRYVITKMTYLEVYKFLKKENLYDAFMMRIREQLPRAKSLRYYVIRMRNPVNPINFFRVTLYNRIDGQYDDDDTINFWLNLDDKWNHHLSNLLKETI